MSEDIKEIIVEFETLPPIEPRYNLFYINLSLYDNKILPSIVHAPILELKTLSNHLKYIYLGDEKTVRIIVVRNLSFVQEDKLIRVLRSQDENRMDHCRHQGD